jgi:squalene-hopene/tetraprenyl-beta-curcumene cyclase
MTLVAETRQADLLRAQVEEALRKTREHFVRTQHPDGWWMSELEADCTMTCEYLMLRQILGIPDAARSAAAARYLLHTQNEDGGWPAFFGGPSVLSTSIEAYHALKLCGFAREDPALGRTRKWILAQGGIMAARTFTKINLAIFGEFPWRGVPALPAELIELPVGWPFNVYEFASWARATIVPLMVVLSMRPRRTLPPGCDVQELYVEPKARRGYTVPFRRPVASARNVFVGLDMLVKLFGNSPANLLRKQALRDCELWILQHQDESGGWGGIMPAMLNATLALHCLGYPNDHPVMEAALAAIEGFGWEENGMWRLQGCISPVWDTALASLGLQHAGMPWDDPTLQRAGKWLLDKQIFRAGDWQQKNREAAPGGWPFEFHNDWYPDVDDSAYVMLTLARLPLADEERQLRALKRGLQWALSMQCSSGGWAAFDLENTNRLVTELPFLDFGAILDPPTEDVTAHMIELLAELGFGRDFGPLVRGLDFLKRLQQSDGSWYGRWGVNHVYGTFAALLALSAVGEDPKQPYIRRAVAWLEARQNPDGGWGEDCRSYADDAYRGVGPSTASQTSWAVVGLIAAGAAGSEAVRGAIDFLLRTQCPDGTWEEPYFTGTGFPRDFYLNYHGYRNYFPLWALGMYRRSLD